MSPASLPLRWVSLTGAEDSVNPLDLIALSREFPFVEWALLLYPEREGEGRNPSAAWRERFLSQIQGRGRCAAHLCGKRAFERLLSEGVWPELLAYDRIQANINARANDFTEDQVLRAWEILERDSQGLIIQTHSAVEALARSFLASAPRRAGVLFDESKGRGTLPLAWPKSWPGVSCGYAGGLGPASLPANLPLILNALQGAECWIDMESSLRTDDRFDLSKARQVLEISGAFVQPGDTALAS